MFIQNTCRWRDKMIPTEKEAFEVIAFETLLYELEQISMSFAGFNEVRPDLVMENRDEIVEIVSRLLQDIGAVQ